MKIKISFCVLLAVFSVLKLKAQTNYCYSYDASGNRISRTICLKSSAVPLDSLLANQPKEEKIGEVKLVIYPNPVKSILILKMDGNPEEIKGQVSVYDIEGRGILNSKIMYSEHTINFSLFPSGIYILKVYINNKTSEWKIVKQ